MSRKTKRFTRADLNEKQEGFVDYYMAAGGTREGATAAVQVVYGYEGNAASSKATQLLKHEKIRDVIVEETLASFAAMGALAADKLMEVLDTGQWHGQAVKPSDGLKAIGQALERGIGPIAHVHKHTHEHELEGKTGKELRAAVIGELRKLEDHDRSAMLQAIGIAPDAEIVDVDAIEVDPDAPWGRKKDGTPKAKPGKPRELVPVHKQSRYYEPPPTDLQVRIAQIKKKKMQAKRKKAEEQANGLN